VTYPQFQAFIEADDGFDDDRWWVDMPDDYKKQKMKDQRTKTANAPRDSVSWYQCVAFARWLNHRLQGLEVSHPDGVLRVGDNAEIRLPTEWEWQWAAQGGAEAREYPWEGGWLEGYANTRKAGMNRTTAVGMYPHGAAVSGALDMAGNLREWCANKYDSPDEVGVDNSGATRVVRGGAFDDLGNDSRCASRDVDGYPLFRGDDVGLRVCCGAPY
jgi:formylglycine-generating enzyme required for sulfatase activity